MPYLGSQEYIVHLTDILVGLNKMKYTVTKITPVTKFHSPYYLTNLILLIVWKKINLHCCREMHTSTWTHTGWGVVLMTGFPPLLCQEEYDVGNFFLTLGFHLGLFSCLLTLQWTLVVFYFFTDLQVHLICIHNIQWILYVLDNVFCSLLLLTLVLPSSKLWVSLIHLWWVFAFLVWFQVPSYQPRPVFV